MINEIIMILVSNNELIYKTQMSKNQFILKILPNAYEVNSKLWFRIFKNIIKEITENK